MKKLTDREIREIQLRILSETDRFCRARKIPYTVYAGSLIGAVLHKGFIPWDDDIDIAMLRSDYERFIREYTRWTEAAYSVDCIENNSPNALLFAKICDHNTIMREEKCGTRDMHVAVDLFPLDNSNMNCIQSFRARVMRFLLNFVCHAKCYSIFPCDKAIKIPWRLFRKLVTFFIPRITALRFWQNMAIRLCPAEEATHVTEWCDSYALGKSFHRKEIFSDYIDLPFETLTVRAVREYDEVLKRTYPNYLHYTPSADDLNKHGLCAYRK